MATVKEATIQKYWLQQLKEQAYGLNQHGGAYTNKGVPDIIACVNGIFCGVELKDANGTVTPVQLRHLSDISKRGGIAILANSKDAYGHFMHYVQQPSLRLTDTYLENVVTLQEGVEIDLEVSKAVSERLRASTMGLLVIQWVKSEPFFGVDTTSASTFV